MNETHVVKTSQFVNQPVELEQVQVPVAQNRPLVDGSSCRGGTDTWNKMKVKTIRFVLLCPAQTSVLHELVELLQEVLPLLRERLHLLLHTEEQQISP